MESGGESLADPLTHPSTGPSTGTADVVDDPALATMFRGRNEYAIDDKGRLTLPAHMRRPLIDGGHLVVLDGRATVFNDAGYAAAVATLNELVTSQGLTRAQVRGFLSNTHPINLDAQGRIVIPHAVRIQAELDREVVVLGAGPRIEIVAAAANDLEALLGVDEGVVDALDRAGF